VWGCAPHPTRSLAALRLRLEPWRTGFALRRGEQTACRRNPAAKGAGATAKPLRGEEGRQESTCLHLFPAPNERSRTKIVFTSRDLTAADQLVHRTPSGALKTEFFRFQAEIQKIRFRGSAKKQHSNDIASASPPAAHAAHRTHEGVRGKTAALSRFPPAPLLHFPRGKVDS